jgi:hypothetical protein
VASGRWRVHDCVQHGEEVSRASTGPSIASSEEEEGRLESSGGVELRVMDAELELCRRRIWPGELADMAEIRR